MNSKLDCSGPSNNASLILELFNFSEKLILSS